MGNLRYTPCITDYLLWAILGTIFITLVWGLVLEPIWSNKIVAPRRARALMRQEDAARAAFVPPPDPFAPVPGAPGLGLGPAPAPVAPVVKTPDPFAPVPGVGMGLPKEGGK